MRGHGSGSDSQPSTGPAQAVGGPAIPQRRGVMSGSRALGVARASPSISRVTAQTSASALSRSPASSPTPAVLRSELARLREEGALFFPAPPAETQLPENLAWARSLDASLQGTCFLTRERVERTWTRRFSLVEILEAPDGWQDYAILRRH